MPDKHSRIPRDIQLHRRSRTLELRYEDQAGEERYELSSEYLRVYSPSAEVRGHGKGSEVLQTGKQNVAILGLEPAGNYAVQIIFDDGHDSGLYSWQYLYELCVNKDAYWQDYLQRLAAAGASR